MRKQRWLGTTIGVVLSVGLFLSGTLQAWLRDQRLPPKPKGGSADLIYLPSADQARVMSLGYSTLAADYYWVKALQYYTDPTQAYNRFKNLPDLLDLVVGIDPDFKYAYKFGGIAVPYEEGRGRWRNTNRATSLLERGTKRFAGEWQFHFFLAYNYLNYHGRPNDAAVEFAKAAELPGAPSYLHAFAARVFAVGGAVDRGIALAEEIARSSDDPEVIAMMQSRLESLLTEKQLQLIDRAAKEFAAKYGRLPGSVAELVANGLLEKAPDGVSLDSSGTAQVSGKERMILHKNNSEETFVTID